jgi:hypothetical protein
MDERPTGLAEVQETVARLSAQDALLKEMAEALRHAQGNMPHPDQMIDATLAKYHAMKEGRG